MIKKSSLAPFVTLLAITACKDESGFDPEKWQAAAGCSNGENDRMRMARDLEEVHLRIGMKEQEVIALLGEPEARQNAALVYCLGRSMADYDFYYITFDAENGIKSFRYDPG